MFLFLLYMACYQHQMYIACEIFEGCYGNSGSTAQKVIVGNLTKLISVIAIYVCLPLEAFVL